MAAVWADGRIDTRTSCGDCYNVWTLSQNVRGVASADVFSGFLMAGFTSGTAGASHGLRYLAYGASTSSQLSIVSSRFVRIESAATLPQYGPAIVATPAGGAGSNGLMYMSLPNTTAYSSLSSAQFTLWPGQEVIQGWSTAAVDWQYHLQPGGATVWITDSSQGGRNFNLVNGVATSYNLLVLNWNATLNRYVHTGYIGINPAVACQIITGRQEGSEYVLYVGCNGVQIFRYWTSSRTMQQIYSLPTGQSTLGISFAPVDPRIFAPTPSATPTQTATTTASVSVTASPTSSPTSTPSPSVTRTGTTTSTQTRSSTPTPTNTPTPSITASLTVGALPSITASPTPLFNAFSPSSIVVLRSGTGAASFRVLGVAAPVFLDVYEPEALAAGYPATPVSTIAMPTALSTASGRSQFRCSLAFGSWWDRTATGAARSSDGRFLR